MHDDHAVSQAALRHDDASPQRQLTLLDATSIIVGIVVGGGLYETISLVAKNVPSPAWLFGAWIAGGVVALFGAMCYAELATAYPSEGGEYVYLSRAFGRRLGFLFAWTQFWIIRPGSVGAIAYIFARYADRVLPLRLLHESISRNSSLTLYAVGSILVLSLLNLAGAREGKWTQNVLTAVKLAGLLLLALGSLLATPRETDLSTVTSTAAEGSLSLALIFVMFAYGGWNDMPLVAAEVRNPRKNLSRSLMLGSIGIALVYLLANLAFVRLLGFEGVRNSPAVGAEAMSIVLGRFGEKAFSLLVAISCLGAIQGMLFTGARIYYAAGVDHRLFHWLGNWDPRSQSPRRSWILQSLVTVLITVGVGLQGGEQGFERTLAISAAPFWFFILLAIAALPVLRWRDANRERPYRVPAYPLVPLVFFGACLLMFVSSIQYAGKTAANEAAIGLAVMVLGAAIGHFSRDSRR